MSIFFPQAIRLVSWTRKRTLGHVLVNKYLISRDWNPRPLSQPSQTITPPSSGHKFNIDIVTFDFLNHIPPQWEEGLTLSYNCSEEIKALIGTFC